MSSGGHQETSYSTPKSTNRLVLLAVILPLALIALFFGLRGTGKSAAPEAPEAVVARIQPVAGHAFEAAGGPVVLKTGEEVYAAQCTSCHKEGVAGAPKFGDAGAWGPRIKSGFEALLGSALKGKGAMAAQGGGSFSDIEIGRAVAYMANAAGAKFEAPKAPEAAPAAAAPAAAGAAAAVASAAPAAGAAAAAGSSGKATFEAVCTVCHAANSAIPGSPKLGDKAAWAPRIATGVPALVASAIKGKGAMPAKGGKADASDADIKAAVEYIVAASK